MLRVGEELITILDPDRSSASEYWFLIFGKLRIQKIQDPE